MTFDIDAMTSGYLKCAVWADAAEESRARFSAAETAIARKVCAAFVQICGPLALQTVELCSAERFGHDFYLTRCGHGCGYWDRDELTIEACEVLTLRDRDGKPYLSNYRIDTSYQLGDALSCAAYGSTNAISPFAYASLTSYRGWLTIEGSAEQWARGNAPTRAFWRQFELKGI